VKLISRGKLTRADSVVSPTSCPLGTIAEDHHRLSRSANDNAWNSLSTAIYSFREAALKDKDNLICNT
jgi:hypothetical protein